jgi:hypothetical protein
MCQAVAILLLIRLAFYLNAKKYARVKTPQRFHSRQIFIVEAAIQIKIRLQQRRMKIFRTRRRSNSKRFERMIKAGEKLFFCKGREKIESEKRL